MNRKFIAKCLSLLMLFSTSSSLISVQGMHAKHDVRIHQEISEEFSKELDNATQKLEKHPAVLELNGEIAVVGDIHGDVLSINTIIERLTPWLNEQPDRKVLFLGDIFDRGNTTISLYSFLRFFNRFNSGDDISTHRVFVLRGNHETESQYRKNKCSGRRRYLYASHESTITKNETGIINYIKSLPYAAILNENILAVHGGIPSDFNGKPYMDNVRALFGDDLSKDKTLTLSGDIKHVSNGGIYDIIWSDFDSTSQIFKENTRRKSGCVYGWKQLKEFFETLAKVNPKYKDIKHIIHGHNHNEGPFQQLEHDGMTNTTVISSISICCTYAKKTHAIVAIVSSEIKKPAEFLKLEKSITTPKKGGM